MRRKSTRIVLVDSREEVESNVREGKSVRFVAFFDQEEILRVALGVKSNDSKMRKGLEELFPKGYETITYGITHKAGKKMTIFPTFHGYGNAAPLISKDTHDRIERRITYFFKP